MEEVVYTKLTREILRRIENLKGCTKKGMFIKEEEIIEGIDIVKKIVISINPINNDKLYENINYHVLEYEKKLAANYQMISNAKKIGINNTLALIYNLSLNKTYSKTKVLTK